MSTTTATATDASAVFRKACSEFATGVTAVTARSPDGTLAALTANSFTSVSLDPPMVLVCIGRSLSSIDVLAAATHVAIHVLDASDEEVARRFATRGLTGEERLKGIEWAPGRFGEPALNSCACRFSGPVVERVDAGDHLIYLVGAEDVAVASKPSPTLLFHRGRFGPSPELGPPNGEGGSP